MGTEGLTEELNRGKEMFVSSMLKEEIISEEQAETMQKYSIVIAQKGFFGKLWDKIFKKEDSAYFFVVKIVTPDSPTDEEE